MEEHSVFMRRCFELAEMGLGMVAPNPLVGAVLVYNGEIIGEGYHQVFGDKHAEVNCIEAALQKVDAEVISKSTLYVNLEPCSHYGKTPPCTNLILQHHIPHVVICNTDPFAEVNGKGIAQLQASGVNVQLHVLEKEGRELNRRFFTFQEKRRPYVILKWAQTLNGFIAPLGNGKPIRQEISNQHSHRLVHTWRSQEQAIMVGTNTACIDNPRLDVRHVKGKNPLRVLLDKNLVVPKEFHLLNGEIPTLVFTSKASSESKNLRYQNIDFTESVIPQVFEALYRMQIQSIIIEGGRMLLDSFITENCWDEARVFTSPKMFPVGISSPLINQEPIERLDIDDDSLAIYKNIKNLNV